MIDSGALCQHQKSGEYEHNLYFSASTFNFKSSVSDLLKNFLVNSWKKIQIRPLHVFLLKPGRALPNWYKTINNIVQPIKNFC